MPKIWIGSGVLFRSANGAPDGATDETLRGLLFSLNPDEFVKAQGFEAAEPVPVEYSGGEIKFKKAVKIGNWIFQWERGEKVIDGGQTSEQMRIYGIIIIIVFYILLSIAVYFQRKKEKPDKFKVLEDLMKKVNLNIKIPVNLALWGGVSVIAVAIIYNFYLILFYFEQINYIFFS